MFRDSAPSYITSSPSCSSCGQTIGVYEPIIVITPGEEVKETSIAQRPELGPRDGLYHPACYSW